MSASRTVRAGRSSRQTPEGQAPSPEPRKFQVTVQTDGSEHTIPAAPKLRAQLAKQLCADCGGSQIVLSRYFAKPVDGKCYGQFTFQVNTVNKAPTYTKPLPGTKVFQHFYPDINPGRAARPVAVGGSPETRA